MTFNPNDDKATEKVDNPMEDCVDQMVAQGKPKAMAMQMCKMKMQQGHVKKAMIGRLKAK